MSHILTQSLGFEQHPIPQIARFNNTLRSHGKKWVKVYEKHSDLISNLSIMVLNTIVLASKIFKKIPEWVGRTAFAALSFTGIIYLNLQVKALVKTIRDLVLSIRERDVEGIIFTAVKVLVKALDILLTCTLFAASLFSLCGLPHISLGMYAITRPFSILSLFFGMGSELYDFESKKVLIKTLHHLKSDIRIKEFVRCLLSYTCKIDPGVEISKNDRRLALKLFRHIDKSYLDVIKKKYRQKLKSLDYTQSKQILGACQSYLQNQQTFAKANWKRIALGYVSLGICKIWPDSLVQSSVTWGMSALYTKDLIIRKIRQREDELSIKKGPK